MNIFFKKSTLKYDMNKKFLKKKTVHCNVTVTRQEIEFKVGGKYNCIKSEIK